MALNKNALIRYKVLDNCFRNPGRRFFIEDLISECDKVLAEIDPNSNGISRRTIFDDIKFMESSEGWQIELLKQKESKRTYYRYADSSFSINNMPLNEVEVNQLKSAMNILSQFKGMPQFEWVNELLPKLQQGISSNESVLPIMEFENNQFLKGIDLLGQLYNAIHYKTVLKIRYQPFQDEKAFDLALHPYFLKQYNNRWFLFGYNPEHKKSDWNLAIDRIVEIKESNFPYIENSEVDWSEYFDDIIGVTKPDGAALETVVLHFYGLTGKYMEAKPLHGSQKTKWLDKDTLELSIKVVINYELERLILSYADAVRVVGPEMLKQKISERQEKAFKNYR
jgi:predicted DNA-binding transcriptional regulator YafY